MGAGYTEEWMEVTFSYHPPKPGQPEQYQRIRNKARELAELINAECPAVYEAATAMEKLSETVMWANAAIARTATP